MGRKVKQLKNYTSEQVEKLFESDVNNIVGLKMYAILQLTRGYSTRKLEEFYRVTHKQICNWANRFDAEGIEGLRIKPGRGRRSFITNKQKEQLKNDLLKSPEEFGYNTATWSGPVLQKYLETVFQVFYKRASVYVLLHELGFSFQRVRGKYPERDQVKRESAKLDIKKTEILCKTR
jgi:transposase